VLGGAQSLHTNGMDEAYAIPSEEAMKIALRTQQVIALEDQRDQRGGSARRLLLRGALTNRVEADGLAILAKVDALGGTIKAIERRFEEGFAFPRREIADSAYDFARRKAAGEQPVIGVNTLVEPVGAAPRSRSTRWNPVVETRQIQRLTEVRRTARPGSRRAPCSIAWSGRPASRRPISCRSPSSW